MHLSKSPGVSALCAAIVIGLSACGSDSTAPASLSSAEALSSLALGLQALSSDASIEEINASFGGISELLDQVNITIDGQSQTMYGLGVRETYPPGTCEEQIFVDPLFPPQPGVCTRPTLAIALLFWQSSAANLPPDKLVFINADQGSTDFSLDILSSAMPGVAIYLQGTNNFWVSASGTLNSAVAATNQTCNIPTPSYATGATCNYATFDEQGSVSFEEFDPSGASARTMTVTIPRQTLHGLWQAITGIKPAATISAQRLSPIFNLRPRTFAAIPSR